MLGNKNIQSQTQRAAGRDVVDAGIKPDRGKVSSCCFGVKVTEV